MRSIQRQAKTGKLSFPVRNGANSASRNNGVDSTLPEYNALAVTSARGMSLDRHLSH
jgi:hypothetical protein